jgi:hypothetical protein
MAEQPDNRRGVEAALARLAGRELTVVLEEAPPEVPAPVSGGEGSSPAPAPDHRSLLEDIKAQFDAVEEPGR